MKKDKKMADEEMKEPKDMAEKSEGKEEGPSDQEVEMAMNDLLRSHKHKKNKKLMAAIAKMSLDKNEAIQSMADLKMAKQKAFTKDPHDA